MDFSYHNAYTPFIYCVDSYYLSCKLQKSNFKTFSMRWNLFFLFFLILSISCFSQDPYLFIGTYTNGKSKGIYVYRFNESSGTATEVSSIQQKIRPTSASHQMENMCMQQMKNEVGGAVGAYAFEPVNGSAGFSEFPVQSGYLSLLCIGR